MLGQRSEWETPGPAATDFRSDVLTRPPMDALRAIMATSLGDALFREDATTIRLEERVAQLTRFDDAVLVPTGTMANQLALCSLVDFPRPYSVLCARHSHVYEYEAGGMSLLSGALVQCVLPKNGLYITLEDVQAEAYTEYDVHQARTRLISLENTAHGNVVPTAEIRRICVWARTKGIKVHLDGARLWEAVVTGRCSLMDYAGLVDALTLDFSKGLGAAMGAVMVSSHKVVQVARNFAKAIGGGMRGAGVIAAMAEWAVHAEFDDKGGVRGSKLRQAHDMARRVELMWVSRGGLLTRPCETNMVWVDLASAGMSNDAWNDLGRKFGVQLAGSRLVMHWQISEDAIRNLASVFDTALNTA